MKTERDLIYAFTEAVKLCDDYYHWLDETPLSLLNCFAMIKNIIITSTESLNYYWRTWLPLQIQAWGADTVLNDNRADFEFEYTQRQLIVLKTAVIFSLSIVEFIFSTAVKETKNGPLHDWYTTIFLPRKKKRQHLTLSKILIESLKRKIIINTDYRSWQGIITLRNVLVHNNGIAHKSSVLRIGDLQIALKKEAATKMTLRDISRITKTLIILTRNWLEKFLESHEIQSPDRLREIDLD